MERKQTKPYRLIDLRTGRVWDFTHAAPLTELMFVLTMWPPHAVVYKAGRRYTGAVAGDVAELAARLEGW